VVFNVFQPIIAPLQLFQSLYETTANFITLSYVFTESAIYNHNCVTMECHVTLSVDINGMLSKTMMLNVAFIFKTVQFIQILSCHKPSELIKRPYDTNSRSRVQILLSIDTIRTIASAVTTGITHMTLAM